MTISFNVRLRGELAMPHEKERKRERGMQFRVTLRMLILQVSDHQNLRSFGKSLPNLLRQRKRNFVIIIVIMYYRRE